jgi:hypothetical protein
LDEIFEAIGFSAQFVAFVGHDSEFCSERRHPDRAFGVAGAARRGGVAVDAVVVVDVGVGVADGADLGLELLVQRDQLKWGKRMSVSKRKIYLRMLRLH